LITEPQFFFKLITEPHVQDCGLSDRVKDTSILPSKIDQMAAS